jgi:hypothetical protein
LGLPRFRHATFEARFPFALVRLDDPDIPLQVTVTGWSPFIPGDADSASLPVAGLEYKFINSGTKEIDAVFSFHAKNLMAQDTPFGTSVGSRDAVRLTDGGFVLFGGGAPEHPWEEGTFAAWVDDPAVRVNPAWFRGSFFDTITMVWRDVATGAYYNGTPISDTLPSPGASLFLPLKLAPGETQQITLRIAWYVARSNLRVSGGGRIATLTMDGSEPGKETYIPWYAGRFSSAEGVMSYWRTNYNRLRENSSQFTECFYNTTFPPEVVEAAAANLTILKSPTILRQTDGRLWAWEGCCDSEGSCPGSCTHVLNYAQSIPHLFPTLERTLRETEFGPSQDANGHQVWRTAIPIRYADQDHTSIPAADGQLGGIMKVYRDWRISGDADWLKRLWPKVSASLDFCIRTWDPRRRGWLEEPQLNTYDMPLWGPNSMCTSIYLGALKAAILMGEFLGNDISSYRELLETGRRKIGQLFNGEYFHQNIPHMALDSLYPKKGVEDSLDPATPEALALAKSEGPKYQYGEGCLSDGVVGEWLAVVCGIGGVLERSNVVSHLRAVYKYNFRAAFTLTANTARAIFASQCESGLQICTWPTGRAPTLPLIYAPEVFTGVEYQVASHLIFNGMVAEGLELVRSCRRRYSGVLRNPFDELEAGHWYARAMASYSLLQALSGARYDAVEETLYLAPSVKGDFRAFISTASGYGHVGIKDGVPFIEPVAGTISVKTVKFRAEV